MFSGYVCASTPRLRRCCQHRCDGHHLELQLDKANGMTVLQAIPLNIYTLRTLRSDESAGYITLGRTCDISARDTDGDAVRSAGIWTVTISSCQIRRTTLQIDARMRPVRLRSRALHQVRVCL